MLSVRRDQIDALRPIQGPGPSPEIFEHVRKHFPIDFSLVGEPALREAIRLAQQRAQDLGFSSQDQVQSYFDLILTFGSDLHRDPALPFVAEALDTRRRRDPVARIARLHESAMEFLDQTTGADGEHYRTAMLRAKRLDFSEFEIADELRTSQLDLLQHIYPQKAEALGDEMDDYIDELEEEATARNIQSKAGAMLHAMLCFLLGIGVSEDPLHPWVWQGASIDAKPFDDPEALFERAKAHAERAIELMRAKEI